MEYLRTADIRQQFKDLLAARKFTAINREASMTSLVGSTTIEIVGASFIADEDAIFGKVSWIMFSVRKSGTTPCHST